MMQNCPNFRMNIWFHIVCQIFAKLFAKNVNGGSDKYETRSSWLNCALRDDEAVYWVSIGNYEAVAVGN